MRACLVYLLLLFPMGAVLGMESQRQELSDVTVVMAGVAERGLPSVRKLVPDSGWTWFNDERVVVVDGVLYIGSVDSVGQVRVDMIRLDAPAHHQRTEGFQLWRPYLQCWKDAHSRYSVVWRR